jgi:hypothetical protein
MVSHLLSPTLRRSQRPAHGRVVVNELGVTRARAIRRRSDPGDPQHQGLRLISSTGGAASRHEPVMETDFTSEPRGHLRPQAH